MTRSPSPRVGAALTVGVLAVSWAAILARLADAPPLVIAAWRLTIASAVVVPLVVFNAQHRAALRQLTARGWLTLAASGLALALHFGTWISSLKLTTIASSVALVTTQPIWVGLLSTLVLRERPRAWSVVAMVVAMAGSVLIAGADFGLDARALQGDALALAGAVFAAIYLVIGRRVRGRLELWPYVGVVYPLAGAALLLAALASGAQVASYPAVTWAWFAALALVPQFIGHTLLNYSLKHTSAALVSIAILGEPVFATLLAVPLLHEQPGPLRLVGALVVLAGVALAAWSEGQLTTTAPATAPTPAAARPGPGA